MTTAIAEPEGLTNSEFAALVRLNKDLKTAAQGLPKQHARYIVDLYYQVQELRIELGGRIRAAGDSVEPVSLLGWLEKNVRTLEGDIQLGLNHFAKSYRVGRWAQSVTGVGPVISAGLLAHLDIRRAPTAGQFWRFAGLDPSVKWLGREGARSLVKDILDEGDGNGEVGEHTLREAALRTNRHVENLRRLLPDGKITRKALTDMLAKPPYSNGLKCLCAGKIGDSFVRVQGRKNDFYGAVYAERRAREVRLNAEGKYAVEARQALAAKNFGRTTASYKFYTGTYLPGLWDQWYATADSKRDVLLKQFTASNGQGLAMLPPLHIHRRAKRYAVKLFMSHLHQVMYEDYHGEKGPVPYAFSPKGKAKLGDGHRHFVAPPNWPGNFPGRGLRELYGE